MYDEDFFEIEQFERNVRACVAEEMAQSRVNSVFCSFCFAGSLQEILARRQQSSDVATRTEHRRSRRKSSNSISSRAISAVSYFALVTVVFRLSRDVFRSIDEALDL
jgi:hypothetical protein